jgi:calmodulin
MNEIALAKPLTGDELAELHEDFDDFDRDGDGLLQFNEFVCFLDGLEADMTEKECHIGFAEIDSDHDGVIEFGEFVEWWRS